MARHDLAWLTHHFEERKIAFGPVRGAGEVADDPQVAARGMIQDLVGAVGRRLRYVRQPLLIDGEGGTITASAPALGQHNDEVMAELGLVPGPTLS